jgi:GNAT superfamily N-acetyltransferase
MREIKNKKIEAFGIKFYIEENGKEIARTYLYLMKNDLHEKPFGLMEDVFVDSAYRGEGLGSKLVEETIKAAKEQGCYKLICTSRHSKPDIHAWYQRHGFVDQGKEFRMDFK